MTPFPSANGVIHLPDVTLVAVTSVAVPETLAALRHSQAQVRFGKSLLLTDKRPDLGKDDSIEWHPIAPLQSREAYSRFMLRDLWHYIQTGHALCVQWDGYVIDGNRWDNSFLEYDYIGAPWPHFDGGPVVGNGGFSLRSKRLLDACRTIAYDGRMAEDVAICRHAGALLEARDGIRFARPDVARRFSYERYRPESIEFGFHGVFNLPAILGRRKFRTMMKTLDRDVIGLREARDIRAWALRSVEPEIALRMVRQIRRLRLQRSGRPA